MFVKKIIKSPLPLTESIADLPYRWTHSSIDIGHTICYTTNISERYTNAKYQNRNINRKADI